MSDHMKSSYETFVAESKKWRAVQGFLFNRIHRKIRLPSFDLTNDHATRGGLFCSSIVVVAASRTRRLVSTDGYGRLRIAQRFDRSVFCLRCSIHWGNAA